MRFLQEASVPNRESHGPEASLAQGLSQMHAMWLDSQYQLTRELSKHAVLQGTRDTRHHHNNQRLQCVTYSTPHHRYIVHQAHKPNPKHTAVKSVVDTVATSMITERNVHPTPSRSLSLSETANRWSVSSLKSK
jgi:site-specific DNA-cytosine methylase